MSSRQSLIKVWLAKLFRSLPIDDKTFNQIHYFQKFHRFINYDRPVTFNEKIQYLKIYGKLEKYGPLVDKYTARDYVTIKTGGQYLNQLIGVYRDISEINFDDLPQKFVLKATHGSKWNIICKDKSELDLDFVKTQCRSWLGTNYYWQAREPVYKHIPPRLICENYLESEPDGTLNDYKFYCFHGRVSYIEVDADRYTGHKRNMYDPDWNLCPFRIIYPSIDHAIKKPECLQEMINLAELLARDFPFVRVDLYNAANRIIFGELTFIPGGGIAKFIPDKWDKIFGDLI
jgi:hypothetical protein